MGAALAVFRVCASLGLACGACAAPSRGPLAGASDAWKNGPEPTSSPAAPATRPAIWDGYAEALRWSAANATPFTSRGHQPEQLVDVHANDVARPAYSALVADSVFPEGSTLVELARVQAGDARGYAMRKQAGQWSYFQLDAQGGLLASGALSLCASCHCEAPADGIFGPPRQP